MLCLVTMAGCSYTFIPQPASGYFTAADDCIQSRIAPGIDTGLAIAGALFLGIPAIEECGDCHFTFPVIAAALGALPWALSALHGYKYTNRCREAHPPDPPAPTAPPAEAAPVSPGEPCTDQMPGVPNAGRCAQGFLCRDHVCVKQ